MNVFTVLRSGGEFTPDHVYGLKRMLNRHLPDHTFHCLTDCESIPWRVPLEHDLPGWWSKMELCRPDIRGPMLYVDLDTVIIRDLSPLVADVSRSIVLRDLFRGKRNPRALQSALMLLTEGDRALVWAHWSADPAACMRLRGDQDVIERVLSRRVRFFQDTHPGFVVGYKSDIRKAAGRMAPEDASVVIFHGNPRPWNRMAPRWARAAFCGPAVPA